MLICKLFTNNFDILFQSIYSDIEDGVYDTLSTFYTEFLNEDSINEFIDNSFGILSYKPISFIY
jgi:hypothetical protein